jgi:small subunit ribosomal protein S15
MISKSDKTSIIKDSQKAKDDTGSSEVQISIMTARIAQLTEHLKIHKKDNHSRRGLLQLVGKRKSLMAFLKKKDYESYQNLISKLGIRG